MSIGFDMQDYIQTYLTAQGVSIKITVNDMDSKIQDCIAVMETGGYAALKTHGSTKANPIIDQPSFQIILHKQYKDDAADILELLKTLLDGVLCTVINDTRYLQIEQTAPPIYLGKVQTERGETNEYSVNYTTIVQEITT